MKKGFTLIEVLIATAIFTLVIVAFIGIFVAITGVQVRQNSTAAVTTQSQFLLQKIQYYIELSSAVSSTPNATSSVLTLRMPSSSIDPTVIFASSTMVYLQQAGGTPQSLTSGNVNVSNLTFARETNSPGHDSVNVSFTVSYNTSNIKQMFVQMLQTSVARVSAATFDSSIYPSGSGSNAQLGTVANPWSSINGIIDFSSGNVGINIAGPQAALDVNGGIRFSASQGTEPGCGSTNRGTLWFTPVDGSGKDTLQLCAYNASGSLAWQTVY
jgi:prepilin-type N-terminal cleavage/methylation domain-containing protein